MNKLMLELKQNSKILKQKLKDDNENLNKLKYIILNLYKKYKNEKCINNNKALLLFHFNKIEKLLKTKKGGSFLNKISNLIKCGKTSKCNDKKQLYHLQQKKIQEQPQPKPQPLPHSQELLHLQRQQQTLVYKRQQIGPQLKKKLLLIIKKIINNINELVNIFDIINFHNENCLTQFEVFEKIKNINLQDINNEEAKIIKNIEKESFKIIKDSKRERDKEKNKKKCFIYKEKTVCYYVIDILYNNLYTNIKELLNMYEQIKKCYN